MKKIWEEKEERKECYCDFGQLYLNIYRLNVLTGAQPPSGIPQFNLHKTASVLLQPRIVLNTASVFI